MSKEDQETVIEAVQTVGILTLWWILAWYQEKSEKHKR